MGIDRKTPEGAKISHHVALAEQKRVLDEDHTKLERLAIALHLAENNPLLKFRRLTRAELEFHDTGDIALRFHSAVDGSFTVNVLANDIDKTLKPESPDADVQND